jgi:hypothetical protein
LANPPVHLLVLPTVVTAAIANDVQRDELEMYMPQNPGSNPQNQPTHDAPAKGGQNMPPGSKTGSGNPQSQPDKGGQQSHSGPQK